jgi:hypothetical protein
MKKLRLLLTEKCDRSCKGCCNKDWELNKLPVCKSYNGYDEIIITGGEPLLKEGLLYSAIGKIPENTPIILYTAKFDCPYLIRRVTEHISGITVTFHNQLDVYKFYLSMSTVVGNYGRSPLRNYFHRRKFAGKLRVNVFKGIDWKPLIKLIPDFNKFWKVKDTITWIKDCPLPDDEVFMRYEAIQEKV